MNTGLLLLTTWMAGCASIGQHAATGAASPRDAGDPETSGGRFSKGSIAPSMASVAPPRDARRAEGDRLSVFPVVQAPTPGHAEAASPLQPGAWTSRRWATLLTDVLSNETLANAAMWIGSQPVRVKVSRDGFFIAVRVATP